MRRQGSATRSGYLTLDSSHPLVSRTTILVRARSRRAGQHFRTQTTLQVASGNSPQETAPASIGVRYQPHRGTRQGKGDVRLREVAMLSPLGDLVVHSDSSQMRKISATGTPPSGWGAKLCATGSALIHPVAVVFDAEALGALRGLQHALQLAPEGKTWVCLDSTVVIWRLHGAASFTSQRHFLAFHNLARRHPAGSRCQVEPGSHWHLRQLDGGPKGGLKRPMILTAAPPWPASSVSSGQRSGPSAYSSGGKHTRASPCNIANGNSAMTSGDLKRSKSCPRPCYTGTWQFEPVTGASHGTPKVQA